MPSPETGPRYMLYLANEPFNLSVGLLELTALPPSGAQRWIPWVRV